MYISCHVVLRRLTQNDVHSGNRTDHSSLSATMYDDVDAGNAGTEEVLDPMVESHMMLRAAPTAGCN